MLPLDIRTILFSIITLQCAWLLLVKVKREMHLLTVGTGVVFIGFSLVNVARLQAIKGVEHLMTYESRLKNVLRTHPYTLSGGAIIWKPYFIYPDEYLRKYYPEFLPKQHKHESGL